MRCPKKQPYRFGWIESSWCVCSSPSKWIRIKIDWIEADGQLRPIKKPNARWVDCLQRKRYNSRACRLVRLALGSNSGQLTMIISINDHTISQVPENLFNGFNFRIFSTILSMHNIFIHQVFARFFFWLLVRIHTLHHVLCIFPFWRTAWK